MKIAIIGAGLSGLSTAIHLLYLTQGSLSIDIFDAEPIGEGTSGNSAGLLHPYPGKESKRFPNAEININEAHRLITESSKNLNQSVVLHRGIVRPAVTDEQITNFKKTAAEHPEDTEWWDRDKLEEKMPAISLPKSEMGALYIKSGLTLDMPNYVKGLWQTLARLSVSFHQRRIWGNERELSQYDQIIYAMGPAIIALPGLEGLPIEPVKGQILILKWPDDLPAPFCSLLCTGYLTMGKENLCYAGSTHEHRFTSLGPDLNAATPEIYRKVSSFFPKIKELEIVGCKAGIRASHKKTKKPLIGRLSKKEWFITGFGSKGLIHHGWLGSLLAEAILKDNPAIIPKEYLPSN